MPDDDTVPDADATGSAAAPSRLADARGHTEDLAVRLARLADEVADSEEMVARSYEASADLRPHAADRLRSGAEDARRFAEHEREQGRRLRGEQVDDQPDD